MYRELKALATEPAPSAMFAHMIVSKLRRCDYADQLFSDVISAEKVLVECALYCCSSSGN